MLLIESISLFNKRLLCQILMYVTLYAGLVEFLLDRNIETDKKCKEMKYEIITNLVASSVFDSGVNCRFQKFVREGAFYVQTVMEVAVEGNE